MTKHGLLVALLPNKSVRRTGCSAATVARTRPVIPGDPSATAAGNGPEEGPGVYAEAAARARTSNGKDTDPATNEAAQDDWVGDDDQTPTAAVADAPEHIYESLASNHAIKVAPGLEEGTASNSTSSTPEVDEPSEETTVQPTPLPMYRRPLQVEGRTVHNHSQGNLAPLNLVDFIAKGDDVLQPVLDSPDEAAGVLREGKDQGSVVHKYASPYESTVAYLQAALGANITVGGWRHNVAPTASINHYDHAEQVLLHAHPGLNDTIGTARRRILMDAPAVGDKSTHASPLDHDQLQSPEAPKESASSASSHTERNLLVAHCRDLSSSGRSSLLTQVRTPFQFVSFLFFFFF